MKNRFGLILIAAVVSACSDSTVTDDPAISLIAQKSTRRTELVRSEPRIETAPGLPEASGVQLEVSISPYKAKWFERGPKFARNVQAKSFALSQFTRTLERTDLELAIDLSREVFGADVVQISLYRAGKVEASATASASADALKSGAKIKFTTPALSDDERKIGFAKLNYDVFFESRGKRSHLPFSFLIYDESSPSLIVPKRGGDCLVYHEPERASGCYQNRTRSTQEVVFNDSVTQHHEVDIQFSGSLNIAWSIVTAQLGASSTVANGTDTSRGSEIHFTNCIECASVIYRQQVETLRAGDVYQVMADGSISWMGSTVLKTSAVAYEFESTGSESQDYSCDIPSKLPVGSTPSCVQN